VSRVPAPSARGECLQVRADRVSALLANLDGLQDRRERPGVRDRFRVEERRVIIEGDATYTTDAEFKPKINKALDLLKSKAATAYGIVTTNIVKIKAAQKSGMIVQTKIYEIGKLTFDASLTWLASTIAHDSLHAKQYADKQPYVGAEAEAKCNQHQLEVLRTIVAPQSECAYLLAIIKKGDHSDLDGDGKYTQKDYELRKW